MCLVGRRSRSVTSLSAAGKMLWAVTVPHRPTDTQSSLLKRTWKTCVSIMHEDGWDRTRVQDLITPAAAAAELWSDAFSSLWKHTLPPFWDATVEEHVQTQPPIMVRYWGVSTREKMARECLMIILLEYRDTDNKIDFDFDYRLILCVICIISACAPFPILML